MKYLFLIHSSSINGATNAVVFFINYLLNKGEIVHYITLDNKSLILAEKGGIQINEKYFTKQKNIILSFFTPWFYSNKRKIIKEKYDFLYANTIVTLRLALEVKKNSPSSRLILHLHEMETIIQQSFNDFVCYDKYITCYIVVSNYTKHYLLSIGICPSKITLINECSMVPKVNKIEYPTIATYNVVMVGEAHWRKGDDIFLLIAKKTILLNSDIHFYWVGRVDPYRKIILDQDMKKLEISSNVTFISEVSNPQDYVAKMDLFILTSREDPFPLAAIEAGMLGLPIVCFDKATGLEGDIKATGGEVVPYLDIDGMSRSIIKFYENRSDILNNKKYIMDYFEKFKPEIICEQLYNVITENR